jgi:hypothetical protein
MKTTISTVLLSLGSTLAFGQAPRVPAMVSELQIGYNRETLKLRDLQASPMLYVANLNGVGLSYSRLTRKNHWRVGVQAGLGDLIAPNLGIRSFKVAPQQEQPLWLVPTLYRGQLELDYRRRIRQTGNRTTWLGLGLQETIGYADGLALSTWAFNSAALRLTYQTRLRLGERHTLVADAALPVLAAVTRMPYSNVVSEPGRSEVATFFGGTRWATLNGFFNPEIGVSYYFDLSRRVAFGSTYRYQYLRYAQPRMLRTADHTFHASIVYKFQQQFR